VSCSSSTLGVNGGYTQQDAQELAKSSHRLTINGLNGPARGRSVRIAASRAEARQRRAEAGPIELAFIDLLHSRAPRRCSGSATWGGIEEGERAIRALCRHPSTAQFIATKLVTHFVSDEPPAASIVSRACSDRRRSESRGPRPCRRSRPARTHGSSERRGLPVAALRALGASDATPNAPVVLRQLRQPVWSPAAPKGIRRRAAGMGRS
jgi:uncharacterized protein (DUF1800 family)